MINYEPEACPKWNLKEFIVVYAEGCPNSDGCKFCHGWKELEFHPLIYKTRPCRLIKRCKDLKGCPNFHSLSEKREIPKSIAFKALKYVPRNRVLSGTFKKNEGIDYAMRVLVNYESNQSHQNYTSFLLFNSDESKNTLDTMEKQLSRPELAIMLKRNSLTSSEQF